MDLIEQRMSGSGSHSQISPQENASFRNIFKEEVHEDREESKSPTQPRDDAYKEVPKEGFLDTNEATPT